MELAGKQILVTGGAGFIGSHLVDRLLEEPVAGVRVLDNLSNGRRQNLPALGKDPRLTLLEGDIADRSTVANACRGIDVVVHLACLGVRHSLIAPMENHRVNAEGTLGLLLASRDAGVARLVHVSSSEVFGTAQAASIDETHPTWPETVYGGSKLAGEAYSRAFFRTYGLPTVVVRPFNTYGPRSHYEGDCGEVIPRTIARALCGLPPIVFGDGEQTRDFLHVQDTVRAIVALVGSDAALGQTVNVGYGEEISIRSLCRLIADAAGRPDLPLEHQDPRPGDVRRLRVDNSCIDALVGFRPAIRLEDGIRELVAAFRDDYPDPSVMLDKMIERNWES